MDTFCRTYLSALILVLLAHPVQGWCVAGPVTLEADSVNHDVQSSTFTAIGRAIVRRNGLTLLADRAIYREKDNEVLAEGGVVLEKDGDTLHCSSLSLNLDTQQGEVTDGDLFFNKNNVHISSRKMAKVGEADYKLERGRFTTCDGENPSWSFTASDIDVTLEEYATGRNALFYIGRVPVLYAPYIVFPAKTERQSGFLMPRIGNSTKKGFNFDLPYYQVFSPSQDATFDLDIQGKRGVGTGLDYRYLRRRKSDGSMLAYGIYDTRQERFRGSVTEKQREFISDSVTLFSSITMVSDRGFFRDYAEEAGDYNRQTLDSNLVLSKRWQRYWLGTEFRYSQNLEPTGPDNRTTLQRLPSLSFVGIGEQLGSTPFWFSLDSSLVNFQRREGLSGQRLELYPKLSLYRNAGPFDLSISAGYREHVYNASGDDAFRGLDQVGIADAAVNVSTPLSRVYAPDVWGAQRVRHTMIPELGYTLVSTQDQSRLPRFDYDDRVLGQGMATWALTNYLIGKFQQGEGAPQYRDLLFLKLSQGYQVSGSRRDLLTLVDDGHALTDLRMETRITPLKSLTISLDSRFNTEQSRFSTVSLAGDYNDKKGNLVGIGYQMARHELEYLEGRLGVTLVKPVIFNYTARYSMDRRAFLEGHYALEYKLQCWSVILSYRDRPDNREFMVNFALAGIGALTPVKAF